MGGWGFFTIRVQYPVLYERESRHVKPGQVNKTLRFSDYKNLKLSPHGDVDPDGKATDQKGLFRKRMRLQALV
jgi:hypothetical protein